MRQKLKTMVTDPARVRRNDPGDPDLCPVGDLHKIFSDQQTMAKVYEGCTTAGIGCIECKGWVADNVIAVLAPIQERRRPFEAESEAGLGYPGSRFRPGADAWRRRNALRRPAKPCTCRTSTRRREGPQVVRCSEEPHHTAIAARLRDGQERRPGRAQDGQSRGVFPFSVSVGRCLRWPA